MIYKSLLICIFLSFYSFGVEVNPPKSWQQQFKIPQGIIVQYILPNKSGGFSPNLNIARSKIDCCKESDPINKLIKKVTTQQARIFPLYKVKEKGKRTVDKVKGGYVITTYAQGSRDLANFQFFFFQGDEFINVVYTCLAKDLDQLRPEFEKSLDTLKPDKRKVSNK